MSIASAVMHAMDSMMLNAMTVDSVVVAMELGKILEREEGRPVVREMRDAGR